MKSQKILFLSLIFSFIVVSQASVSAQSAFRFGTWADTKGGTAMLGTLSKQMATKNPLFLFYPGDLCDSGPTISCLDKWSASYNAGGDLLSKSFPSRGNHDRDGASIWTSYFEMSAVATRIGAKNYTELSKDLTYSFDYENSHFIVVDMPAGDASTISSSQLSWLDADLTAAENRGVVHSFIFWHGPIYPMGGHCCNNANSVVPILNKHPSLSGSFHGHEHLLAHTKINSSKISGLNRDFDVFIIGSAGAGGVTCERGDWCQAIPGFATVDVNGNSFTVNYYNSTGVVVKAVTVNKSGNNPNPTSYSSPTNSPQSTATPTFRPASTITRAPTTRPPVPTVKPTSNVPTPTAPVSCAVPNTSLGSITTAISVSPQDLYKLWVRTQSADNTPSQFWVKIDNNCPVILGTSSASGDWTWTNFIDGNPNSPLVANLSAGNHIVRIIGKNTGTRIDRVMLVSANSACIPSGKGDNCQSQIVNPTSPVVTTNQPKPTKVASPKPTTVTNITDPVTGDIILYPTDDTYAVSGDKDAKYGNKKIVRVKGDSGAIGYLKFDISSLRGKSISNAKLVLKLSERPLAEYQIKTVKDTKWKESSLTYRNKPKLYETIGRFKVTRKIDTIEVDLTSTLKSRSGNVFSLGIVSATTKNLTFFSSENPVDQPVLIITTSGKNSNRQSSKYVEDVDQDEDDDD